MKPHNDVRTFDLSRSSAGAVLSASIAVPRARHEITTNDLETSAFARFERMARLHAGRCAVKWPGGQWSYAELEERANAIAQNLSGFERTKPVVLLPEQKPLAIAAMLGVLKAGGFFVPLDPRHPVERIRQMLENAEPGIILTEKSTRALAATLNSSAREVVVDSLPSAELEAVATPADAVAYIIYTSGSTGKPKGVVHTQRNLLHNIKLYSDLLELGPDDGMTQLHSVSFSAALVDIFAALLNGGMVLAWDVQRDGVAGLGEWLEANRASVMIWAPSPFRALARSLTKMLTTFRVVLLGSEPLLDADVELFRAHFAKSCVLANRLGATEVNHYRTFFVGDDARENRTVPAGFAMPDKEVRLIDARGREVPAGELGEITIGPSTRRLGIGVSRKSPRSVSSRSANRSSKRVLFVSRKKCARIAPVISDGCGRMDAWSFTGARISR